MAYVIAWGGFVVCLALAIWFAYLGYTKKEKLYYSVFWKGKHIVGMWGFAILAFTFALIASINTFVPPYSEGRCEYWDEQTGRDTKFIRNGFWSWDCYVQTDEGWVTR